MSLHAENVLFNGLEIRDTDNHNSLNGQIRGFVPKTLFIVNKLDQQVDFVCQGSRDVNFTEIVIVGSGFNVAANSNSYETLTDYFPWIRLVASCATAPTTGDLKMYMELVA